MVSPRRRAHIGLAAGALVLVVGMTIVIAGAFERPRPPVGLPGTPATSFRLPDVHGNLVSLKSMRGSVIMLSFFPSPDTRASAEGAKCLAELGDRLGPDGDVKLVSIYSDVESMDYDQLRLVRNRAVDSGQGCLTLLDPGASVAEEYGVRRTPTYLLIDPSGLICHRDDHLTLDEFTDSINQILAAKFAPDQQDQQPSASTAAILGRVGK